MDPPPAIVTIMDNKDYIGVLLYSSYTTITGWGVLHLKASPGFLCLEQIRAYTPRSKHTPCSWIGLLSLWGSIARIYH